jgi:phosphoadenosine phosphosulfate reductase
MIGLAFSGGKDSWACLHLHKDNLDDIIVLWVDTGKNYPEALESVNRAKLMCKTFMEIKVDRDAQNSLHGLPSDVIPFANTEFGQSITGKTDITIQSYFNCCLDNVTKPLMGKVKELGITTLISGKRNDEGHLSSSHDGEIVDGITHLHPIENWTEQQVLDYLETKMYVPFHLRFKHSSLDCYDCSGYLKHTKDIFEWAADKHPELHAKKVFRINQIKTVLNEAMETI